MSIGRKTTMKELVTIILENIAYLSSIVFQLTAAILLIGNTDTKRDKIIKSYVDKHKAIAFDENEKLLDSCEIKETVKNTYINKISFIYLFIGYLVGIFGTCSINKAFALIIVGILVSFLFAISHSIANRKRTNFETLSLNDIPREKGVTIMKLKDDH